MNLHGRGHVRDHARQRVDGVRPKRVLLLRQDVPNIKHRQPVRSSPKVVPTGFSQATRGQGDGWVRETRVSAERWSAHPVRQFGNSQPTFTSNQPDLPDDPNIKRDRRWVLLSQSEPPTPYTLHLLPQR